MFIIDCLPIKRGLNKGSLSYFGSNYLEPGSLIKINVRNKNESAIVVGSRPLEDYKSEIKSANFQLKKVMAFKAKPFLQREFLLAIKETAHYFATSEGAILEHLIPAFVLESPNILTNLKPITETKLENQKEILILQNSLQERLAHYKSLIREEFAKKHSVYICLPQNEDIKDTKSFLEKGIEAYTIAFHKDLTKKEWREEWQKISSLEHPVLIIATAKMLFVPRSDLGLIVLDRENEQGWKTLSKPFFDLRIFIENLAKQKNTQLILGDTFLRIETLHRHHQKELTQFERLRWQIDQEVGSKVVDLREINKKEKEFKILSPELLFLLKETFEKKRLLFIFTARKGLASNTICRDCGESVKCNNCASPMVLYKTKTDGIFKCPQCGESRSAAEYCQNCKSWKLAAYGSGIDKLKEEIKKNFPDLPIFEIHKDLTKTNTKAQNAAEQFLANPGSVLLGTEMAFSYLHKKVWASVIASFDSFFSIPDFRIKEKIFHIILETKALAKEKFLIQTRNPDDEALLQAMKGDLLGFYQKEVADRRILNYPPHGTFIKVTVRGSRALVQREETKLKGLLEAYEPVVFYSIYEKRGEQLAINAVIKFPREDWPNPELIDLLRSLPPSFEIKINPDSLL